MLDKLKTNYKGFWVTCLMIAIVIYAIVGLWCWSAAMIAGVFKISIGSGMAVLFIMFVLWELFAAWIAEARGD